MKKLLITLLAMIALTAPLMAMPERGHWGDHPNRDWHHDRPGNWGDRWHGNYEQRRHFFGGQWWGYGIGSCWRWYLGQWVWVCGDDD